MKIEFLEKLRDNNKKNIQLDDNNDLDLSNANYIYILLN